MEIVLVHPEIPQNTGSIARTCAATRTPLHLIEPLGFTIDEKRIRRAGLDYWPYVNLSTHSSWEEFTRQRPNARYWYCTKSGTIPYYQAMFAPHDLLVFGNESNGLAPTILEQAAENQLLAIPMEEPRVRSLNISNAVSIVLYEARRQLAADEPFLPRRTTS